MSQRTINDLTYEEKIKVAEIVCARHNRHYRPDEISYEISTRRDLDVILLVRSSRRYIIQIQNDGVGFVEYYMGGAGNVNHYCPGQYQVAKYLESIGINTDLSVSQYV